MNCRLHGENHRGDFLAGKVACNRRNNIRAVVQTTGTAPGWDVGEWRRKMIEKIKWNRESRQCFATVYLKGGKGRKEEIVGRHMSRGFRASRYAVGNSAEMDVSVPGCRSRRWRSGSTDARGARFSRVFDACGMHRRRSIIYILCEHWQLRGLKLLDALWLQRFVRNACRQKERSIQLAAECEERSLYEMIFRRETYGATSLFEQGKSYSSETESTDTLKPWHF